MQKEALEARFSTLIDLYHDSPNVTVTYMDLCRVYEDMLAVMDLFHQRKIGFAEVKELKK